MKPEQPAYNAEYWDSKLPDMCEIPMDWGIEALQMQEREWADICRENKIDELPEDGVW